MLEAKYVEIRDLVNRSSFRAVLRTDLPNFASLITARYVLTVKSEKLMKKRYKAWYLVGKHLDSMKDFLVFRAQTIQCVSVDIVQVVAKIKASRVWVVDVKLNFLQYDKPFVRKIFIANPAPVFKLSVEHCPRRPKPIDGLAKSGDEWHRILDDDI